VSLANKEIVMKLLFSTLVLASGAAMAGAAALPVVVGGIAAMCCLLGKRMRARRALDERYARGDINREEYVQRRKDLGQERYSATAAVVFASFLRSPEEAVAPIRLADLPTRLIRHCWNSRR
jgi:Short C-terminal domain